MINLGERQDEGRHDVLLSDCELVVKEDVDDGLGGLGGIGEAGLVVNGADEGEGEDKANEGEGGILGGGDRVEMTGVDLVLEVGGEGVEG